MMIVVSSNHTICGTPIDPILSWAQRLRPPYEGDLSSYLLLLLLFLLVIYLLPNVVVFPFPFGRINQTVHRGTVHPLQHATNDVDQDTSMGSSYGSEYYGKITYRPSSSSTQGRTDVEEDDSF